MLQIVDDLTERELLDDLERAWKEFKRAKFECGQVTDNRSQFQQEALVRRAHAMVDYSKALKRFSTYVTRRLPCE